MNQQMEFSIQGNAYQSEIDGVKIDLTFGALTDDDFGRLVIAKLKEQYGANHALTCTYFESGPRYVHFTPLETMAVSQIIWKETKGRIRIITPTEMLKYKSYLPEIKSFTDSLVVFRSASGADSRSQRILALLGREKTEHPLVVSGLGISKSDSGDGLRYVETDHIQVDEAPFLAGKGKGVMIYVMEDGELHLTRLRPSKPHSWTGLLLVQDNNFCIDESNENESFGSYRIQGNNYVSDINGTRISLTFGPLTNDDLGDSVLARCDAIFGISKKIECIPYESGHGYKGFSPLEVMAIGRVLRDKTGGRIKITSPSDVLEYESHLPRFKSFTDSIVVFPSNETKDPTAFRLLSMLGKEETKVPLVISGLGVIRSNSKDGFRFVETEDTEIAEADFLNGKGSGLQFYVLHSDRKLHLESLKPAKPYLWAGIMLVQDNSRRVDKEHTGRGSNLGDERFENSGYTRSEQAQPTQESPKQNYYKMNEGERVIGGSEVASVVFDLGGFLLTNQRVIKVDRTGFGGVSKVHSFSLENLDSIETVATKNISLVVGAILFLLIALVNLALIGSGEIRDTDSIESYTGVFVGVGGSVLLFLMYYLTRRKVIRLSSGSSQMLLNVAPMSHEEIQELVFEIEQAKQTRLEGIQKAPEVGPDTLDAKSRLKELKDLLEEGLISEDEYNDRRKQILDEL